MATARKADIVTVTPHLAQAWLTRNTKNRPIRKMLVARYTEMIKRGAWHFGPDSIAFDTNGVLVNGQHRLAAIVAAGASADFTVIEGVDPEAFAFFDGGAKRNLSDHLSTLNFTNTNTLAAISRVVANIAYAGVASRRLVGGGGLATRLENDHYIEFVTAYADELEAAVQFVRNLAARAKPPLQGTVTGVLYALYSVEHEITDFLVQVCEGIGIQDRRSPAFLLRKRLMPDRPEALRPTRVPRYEQFAYSILAANLHIAGQSRTMLKWVPTNQNPFPQPEVDLTFWRERMPDWGDLDE